MTTQVKAQDAVVEANRKLLLDRSNVGINKYGVTLEKSGLNDAQLVQHALEEALDLANYLQALLQHLKKPNVQQVTSEAKKDNVVKTWGQFEREQQNLEEHVAIYEGVVNFSILYLE